MTTAAPIDPPTPSPLPAATARAMLAGLRALDLDVDAIRREAGLDAAQLERLDAVVPVRAFEALFEAAARRAPRDELPTELGMAIPFGAFGALDFLAGSSGDVEAGFVALSQHFRQVATQFAVQVGSLADGGGIVELVWREETPVQAISDEFTLAVLFARFRGSASGPLHASAVRLTGAPPARPTRHAALFDAPVTFGCSTAAIEIPRASWRLPQRRADPALQATLRALASHLELGGTFDDVETAVRARLRAMLPDGVPTAHDIARALGLSERTLQRRLGDAGTSFTRVLDAFREAESERLLVASVPLGELALRLGFSDQTAWNRAFRRWKGTSPRQWCAARRASA